MNSSKSFRSRLRSLRTTAVGRVLNVPRRLAQASRYYLPQVPSILSWAARSREDTNFTYDLTDDSLRYLAHTVAVATGASAAIAQQYIAEARSDWALERTVIDAIRRSPFRFVTDERCEFGRRLGWYAIARIRKPRVVVETGVDKGLGAILLCSALLRNEAEGVAGLYYGTDIDPKAGWLLCEPYSRMGRLLIGDSIESLKNMRESIDLFINDSDHSADYEYREYQTVAPKLSADAIVLGDNAHVTPMLARFAEERGMDFLHFREVPKAHWYPGCGIGIAFRRSPRRPDQ